MTGMSTITAATLAQHGVAYAQTITTAARNHGLDPALLAAVAAQETGGPDSNRGHNVVGDGGHGHGLFQIDDRYHAFARTAGAMDPNENADYAASMLQGLIQRYGSVHRALSAYNAGNPNSPGTVTQWGDGRRLGYADSVLRHEARITGENATAHSLVTTAPSESARFSDLAFNAPPLPPPAHHRRFQLVGDDAALPADGSDDTE